MFDRLTLTGDLADCRGQVLARRGQVISPEAIAEVAQRTSPGPWRALGDTAFAGKVCGLLREPAYAAFFRAEGARDAIERALSAVRLPEVLFEELAAVGQVAETLERHAFATACVAVRMLLAAVGPARALPELAAAGLLHDLGMRHLPARLHGHAARLEPGDARLVACHPLLGAFHLATVLGQHPAVAAARSHHWRCGQGYPGLATPPARSVEVISVASAFAALTQPRPFRSAPFDARGAVDVLVAEATVGQADATSVKLLVHALRGGSGDPRALRFGVVRDGHAPAENLHTHLAPPARSRI